MTELTEIGLLDEQAALRRVATLVAEGATAAELFAAVATEVATILAVDAVLLSRYGPGATMTVVASALVDPKLDVFPNGTTWPLDGHGVSATVYATGRAARVDDYTGMTGAIVDRIRTGNGQSSVGVPIIVDGATWGVIAVGTRQSEPLPPTTEDRLRDFTGLLATAIANVQARDDLRRVADAQAALRRIATLVAQAADPDAVFFAVCEEAGHLLGARLAALVRFTDGMSEAVADWHVRGEVTIVPGTRHPLEGVSVNALIASTGEPARVDYETAPGALAERLRELGIKSGVGAPVVVDGKLWGALILSSEGDPLPQETEVRLSDFGELVAMAISNTANRAELLASRARIVAAGDEARRRIERNLHDGTQQRLIALGMDLQRMRAALSPDQQAQQSGLEQIEQDLESVLEDVREVSRGLHPALLSRAGLAPALRELARRSPIPVDINIDLGQRAPASIETAIYYVVAEALTNAIKHSEGESISITVVADDRGGRTSLHATIADDGIGGADPEGGSGLMGAGDRVDALGGHLTLDSPPGVGTTISIELPFATGR